MRGRILAAPNGGGSARPGGAALPLPVLILLAALFSFRPTIAIAQDETILTEEEDKAAAEGDAEETTGTEPGEDEEEEDEEEEFLDWGEEGEEEEFKDWDDGDDGGDDGEPEPPPAPTTQEVVVEYRQTDIFEEPFSPFGPDNLLFPQPDRLIECSYSRKATHVDFFKIEQEYYSYDEPDSGEAPPDSGWVMLFWERTLSTGASLDLDYGQLWAEGGGSGLWFAGALGWSPAFNIDCYARVRLSRSLDDASGLSARGRVKAALTAKTALEGSAFVFTDDEGSSALQGQLRLAQYLAARTGLHAVIRGSSSRDDEGHEPTWNVASLELRHRLPTGTLLRASYRLYDGRQYDAAKAGMTNVTATGYTVGAEQIARRGSFGILYRQYGVTEDFLDEQLVEGTWRVFVKLWF